MPCSAALTSAIEANRSAARFARHRSRTAATASGTSTRGGSSRITALMTSTAEPPVNGRRPLTSSYSTTPKEKMSERSSSGRP
jgi:hypothetical protein